MNSISAALTEANLEVQKEILVYFENLNKDDNGWKFAINALNSEYDKLNSSAIFFYFQVIHQYIKTRYQLDNEENKLLLKQYLCSWFLPKNFTQPLFILNKYASMVKSLFLVEYPVGKWNSFFHDFLANCHDELSCNLFLRVLEQINSEIADRDLMHTFKDIERGSIIKDLMRDNCVLELAQFWFNIINNYQESSPNLICLCLSVMGSFVSWIDIGLITNESVMSNLLKLFEKKEFRGNVLDCFNGILRKGMDPLTKTNFIEQFCNLSCINEKLANIDVETDLEFLTKFAKFFNNMGIELIECHKKLNSKNHNSNPETIQLEAFITSSLENKFQIMIKFLGYNNCNISILVHPFAREYIKLLKCNPQKLNQSQLENKISEVILVFLKILPIHCKYSQDTWIEDENWSEDEDLDNDLIEYRKSQRILFENLMFLNGNICSNIICLSIIEPVINDNISCIYSHELAMYYLHLIGDHFNLIGDTKRVENLVESFIVKNVNRNYKNAILQINLFEIITRFEKLFSSSLNYLLPKALESFLGESGLKNENINLRSKISVLFNKFLRNQIKSKNNHKLFEYFVEIVKSLEDCLKFNSYSNCVLQTDAIYSNEIKSLQDIQLQLYESITFLIVNNILWDNEKKLVYLNGLLIQPVLDENTNIFVLMQNIINLNNNGQSKFTDQCQIDLQLKKCSVQLAHLITLITYSSKAFSNSQGLKQINGQYLYLNTFEQFIKIMSLNINKESIDVIQTALRQLLHRLIVCLEEKDIIPLLPVLIESIFLPRSHFNEKTVQEIVPLINQIVCKFKNSWMFQRDIMPFLNQLFLPFITFIFTLTNSGTLNKEENLELQKAYFYFLSIMANNNLIKIFSSLNPQVVEQVLISLLQGIEINDVTTQKGCFVVLKKFVERICISNEEENKSPANNRLNGSKEFTFDKNRLIEFMYSSVIPTSLMVFSKLVDDNQISGELISFLQTIHQARGDEEFCRFLSQCLSQRFPFFTHINQVCQAFICKDSKLLKNMFKQLHLQVKKLHLNES